jgi:hypothetical protein
MTRSQEELPHGFSHQSATHPTQRKPADFPSAVAQAMEFQRGEIVEWIVEDKNRLLLRRRKVPTTTLKKTKRGKA